MGDCVDCRNIVKKILADISEPNVFPIHLNVAIFGLFIISSQGETKAKNNQSHKRQKVSDKLNEHLKTKKKTLNAFKKYVCALQNTHGGYIIVHFIGLESGDLYIGHFDEYFGKAFNDIIPNGKLLTDIYSRQWISDNYLKIFVAKADVVCTANFNSKRGTDHELTEISSYNVLDVLGSRAGVYTRPVVRGIENLENTFEDRNIQVKAYKPKDIAEVTKDVSTFTDYLWSGLKLRDNLSAMTKVAGGGSYYVGVSEVTTYRSYQHCQEDTGLANTTYISKRLEIDGLNLPFPEDDIRQEIYEKINTHVSILETSGTIKTDVNPQEIILVEFHKLPDENEGQSKHVIEVAIGQIRGIVFYDKEGPRSYFVAKKGEIKRMPFEDWARQYTESAKRIHVEENTKHDLTSDILCD